jgi:CxxC motif-containing protein (DUF1111 family)
MKPSLSPVVFALLPGLAALVSVSGCGSSEPGEPAPSSTVDAGPDAASSADASGPAAEAGPDLIIITAQPSDQPLPGLSAGDLDRFKEGDGLFDLPYRANDGLGPLYIRSSCGSCHEGASKGPGGASKFQIVDIATGKVVPDAPETRDGFTERPYTAAGATTPLRAPAQPLAGHSLVRSTRLGPTVMGRGYLEAIADSEIERVEAEQAQRSDGIHGRINRVTYHSVASAAVPLSYPLGTTGLIGRFGLKARIPTVDDFTADAFQGDMGLTSPLRPNEPRNPDGLTDDLKPGVDVPVTTVAVVAAYVRTLAIPARDPAAAAGGNGPMLFQQTLCAACHVPALKTRADHPLAALAGIDAPVYSDLLLHDMGDTLADDQMDESAGPHEWRTAPLIALRFQRSFLHDGRARTIAEAITGHGGPGSQANVSVEKWNALGDADRKTLLRFVSSL